MKSALLPLALFASLTLFSTAQAEEETNFHTAPKQDYHAADRLESQAEDISMTSDIQEADAVAYKGVENDAKIEAANLKKDIKRLEAQIANLKAGAEQAKKNAELAQKRTDLVRQENGVARRGVAEAMKKKQAADKEKQFEEQKLAAVQAEAAAIAEENRKVEGWIQMAKEDRAKIMERANTLRAQNAANKQKALDTQARAKLMKEQNKVMDEKVTRAEARVGTAGARNPSAAK